MGDPEDLSESLRVSEEAVAASPQATEIMRSPLGTTLQDPNQEIHALNTLAARLDERFQLTGSMNDLNRSIEIMEKLITAVPTNLDEWTSTRVEWLLNISASLQRRYEQGEGENNEDLDYAIELSRTVLELVSNGNSPRGASALCSVAHLLGQRAHINNEQSDLDEAIDMLRKAQQYNTEHSGHIEIASGLALRIFQRSEMIRESNGFTKQSTKDLAEAIEIASSTLSNTPSDSTSYAHLQNYLGLFFYAEFCNSKSQEVAKRALKHLWEALNSAHYTSVFRRIQAGRLIVHLCCVTSKWKAGYTAAEETIKLIPKLSARTISNSDKQRLLSTDDVVGFGADAAAAALNTGESGYAALSLLEMGRGSLAASVLELRIDLAVLGKSHPQFAKTFEELQQELQDNSSPRKDRATREFDTLIETIRRAPGFETFLKTPSEQEMCEAARDGPIVVLSASRYRGLDAIMIQKTGIDVVSFKHISYQEIEERVYDGGAVRNLESPGFLGWMWDEILRPILERLQFRAQPLGDSQPRIWWIPVGILTRLPIHAAGRHAPGSDENLLDWAVSSYSSSIKAILHTRRRPSHPPIPGESRALLIPMAHTPKLGALPCVDDEIRDIQKLLEDKEISSITFGGPKKPMKKDIVENLAGSTIFHFAGHGKEDYLNPLNSALILNDWETNPMTVNDLLHLNLKKFDPFLAYLSACATGKVTKAKFHDDSIHLISAHQLAGFRHVIGTMWEVNDLASMHMAIATYENFLGKNVMSDDSICRALHKASRSMRDVARNDTHQRNEMDERLLDERDAKLVESSDEKAAEIVKSWIPFIHFGV